MRFAMLGGVELFVVPLFAVPLFDVTRARERLLGNHFAAGPRRGQGR